MTTEQTPKKQRPMMIGINHIALEVGDIDQALEFYQNIFNFKLRGKSKGAAFIDLGDQFLALFEVKNKQDKDKMRHFGLVVDDRKHIEELAKKAQAEIIETDQLEFYDPWGNHIQIVEYKDIQYTKAPEVLKGMGVTLEKSQSSLDELAEKGMVF